MANLTQDNIGTENRNDHIQKLFEECMQELRRKAKIPLKSQPGFDGQSLFRFITDNNRCAIAVFDQQFNFLYVNQRYRQAFRITEPDLAGRCLFLTHPDCPQKWRGAFQLALAGKTTRADDELLARPDGSTARLSWDCRAWHQADGTVGGVLLYVDFAVSDRGEDPCSQAILEQMPLGVALADARTGQICRSNPQFRKFFDPAFPVDWHQLIQPDGRSGQNADPAEPDPDCSRLFSVSRRLPRNDGTMSWFKVKVSPVALTNQSEPFRLLIVEELGDTPPGTDYGCQPDNLTGLPNRFALEAAKKRLDQIGQLPLSCLFGKLTDLKLVNEAFGYAAGDRLLVEAAATLRGFCRKNDVLIRSGGDEFTLLLPQTGAEKVSGLAARISHAFRHHPYNAEAGDCPLTLSLGCATKTAPEESLDQVLQAAANQIYRRGTLMRRTASSSVLSSIKATINEKSHLTSDHSERLASIARELGRFLNLNEDQLEDLELLSTVHDIGKIIIDDRILNKPGKLDEREWQEMKKHPDIGYRIAQASPEIRHVSDSILCHHERWDGKGYPIGLSGSNIPLFARILAVIDAYDAMTHDRPYRKALTVEYAIAEIRRNAGTQFDPDIAEKFARLLVQNTIMP